MVGKWLIRWLAKQAADNFVPIPTAHEQRFLLPRTRFDYAREVGDGLGSGVIMAPVGWIARTFPEAPLTVIQQRGDEAEVVWNHPMVGKIERPNSFYNGRNLWKATIYDYCLGGNAYWLKVRNERTRAVEVLWWLPAHLVEPKGSIDGTVFIERYEYSPGGRKINYDPDEIVHFRCGLNPRNPRVGVSPIYPVLREVFTDDEAANFTGSLLRNVGVPGLVIAPKTDSVEFLDKQDVKEYFLQHTTGDERGKPIVGDIPIDVQQFGFDPRRMVLPDIRDISEERVCAALGVPAAIVGFGSGLQQTKVGATMRELVGLAWDSCLIPMQVDFAETLDLALLPEFEPRPELTQTRFAIEEVSAKQDDENAKAQRITALYQGNVITRAEAREQIGLDSTPADQVYLVPRTLEEFPVIRARALPPGRKQPTETEERVIESRPRETQTQAQIALIRQLEASRVSLEDSFAAAVIGWAERFGDVAERAAGEVLASAGPALRASPNGHRKQDLDPIVENIAEQVLARMELSEVVTDLEDTMGAQYLNVATQTQGDINTTMGLGVNIPDDLSSEIISLGGRRAGLIDLPEQTRARLFQEIAAARELGEGPPAIARRIRDFIPAGPWSDTKVRARVIARTETIYAQGQSAIRFYAQAENVSRVMIFDDRIGYGDDECSALDGLVVSFSEAQQLSDDEHPNGTRSFAPVVD